MLFWYTIAIDVRGPHPQFFEGTAESKPTRETDGDFFVFMVDDQRGKFELRTPRDLLLFYSSLELKEGILAQEQWDI